MCVGGGGGVGVWGEEVVGVRVCLVCFSSCIIFAINIYLSLTSTLGNCGHISCVLVIVHF